MRDLWPPDLKPVSLTKAPLLVRKMHLTPPFTAAMDILFLWPQTPIKVICRQNVDDTTMRKYLLLIALKSGVENKRCK